MRFLRSRSRLGLCIGVLIGLVSRESSFGGWLYLSGGRRVIGVLAGRLLRVDSRR